MKKVQFKTEDLKLGFAKAVGFMWENEKGIQFEYQVSDAILDIFKSPVTERFIPYDEVDDVLYKKSWFSGGNIQIHLSSLKNAGSLPFLKNTSLNFPIKRKQKENAQNFAANAKYELSNYRLNKLDNL